MTAIIAFLSHPHKMHANAHAAKSGRICNNFLPPSIRHRKREVDPQILKKT
jgi:hypothetical protein